MKDRLLVVCISSVWTTCACHCLQQQTQEKKLEFHQANRSHQCVMTKYTSDKNQHRTTIQRRQSLHFSDSYLIIIKLRMLEAAKMQLYNLVHMTMALNGVVYIYLYLILNSCLLACLCNQPNTLVHGTLVLWCWSLACSRYTKLHEAIRPRTCLDQCCMFFK